MLQFQPTLIVEADAGTALVWLSILFI